MFPAGFISIECFSDVLFVFEFRAVFIYGYKRLFRRNAITFIFIFLLLFVLSSEIKSIETFEDLKRNLFNNIPSMTE